MSARERRAVFVADDLGLDAATDDAIGRAVRAGLVREVSAVVTCGRVESAARLVDRAGVGLHLSLTQGDALTGAIRGVTDRRGAFRGMPALLARCLAGDVDEVGVEAEVRAQLDRLASVGVSVTHLDGHQHVHAFPAVRDAVLRALADHPTLHVRVPREQRGDRMSSPRCRVVQTLAHGLARAMRSARPRPRPLPFVGLSLYRDPDYPRAMLRAAARLGAEATEWMVHPRTGDRAGRRELDALCDAGVRARLAAIGVHPARFADVLP